MKLVYAKSRYSADNSLAIRTYEKNEYGVLEPYGNVTICLTDYGLKPDEGYINMPLYKMPDSFIRQVSIDILEEVLETVKIGYGEGVRAKLRPDWEQRVQMCEWF